MTNEGKSTASPTATTTTNNNSSSNKAFRMQQLRQSLLAGPEVEIVEIEIEDDDLSSSVHRGNLYIPRIPPFRGGEQQQQQPIGASTSGEYEEQVIEDEVYEEEEVDDEEEFVEEEFSEYEIDDIDDIEDDDEDVTTNTRSPQARVKSVDFESPPVKARIGPPSEAEKTDEEDEDDFDNTENPEPPEGTEPEDDKSGEDNDDGDDDKPDRDEVIEAIKYILRQEQAVEDGHVTPEQAAAIEDLPLEELTDIMDHFETCDMNSAPIRWDLVLLMVNLGPDDDLPGDDDDDDEPDEEDEAP